MINQYKNKYSYLLFVICCLFVSCIPEEDLGYPEVIRIPKEGGEYIYEGELFVSSSISDYNAKYDDTHGIDEEKDLEFNELQWLRIEYKNPWHILESDSAIIEMNENSPYYKTKLKLIAKPNPNKKSRTLYVSLYSGNNYQDIKVVQH